MTLTVILVAIVVILGGLAVWMKRSSDATWPTNRIAAVARSLAAECPGRSIVQVSLSPRSITVGCAVGQRRVLHQWVNGERATEEFSLPAGWNAFSLDDINIAAGAELAARPDVQSVSVEATAAQPTVVMTLTSGKTETLTAQMAPA